ncbi:hypothetical protein Ciccas_010592 [Cichlidogyrus casuarinus]|uniref:Uncharacterized protein n=1 Tax=Cichlidogyrus casuarinus TaxID=1844966 RepID=A0ABD2PVC1_9PLAT
MAVNFLKGEFYVTDELQNKMHCLNLCGVLRWTLPRQHDATGVFNGPSAVTVLPNGWIAVADRQNKRIQMLRSTGSVRFFFACIDAPVAIASDCNSNIFVITESFHIEVYVKFGKLLHSVKMHKPLNSGRKLVKATACVVDSGELMTGEKPFKRWLIILTPGVKEDLHVYGMQHARLVHLSSTRSVLFFGHLYGRASCVASEDVDDCGVDESSSPSCSTRRFMLLPQSDSLYIAFLMADSLNGCIVRVWLDTDTHQLVPQLSRLIFTPSGSLAQKPGAIIKLPGQQLALAGLIVPHRSKPLDQDPSPSVQIWQL